MRIDVISRGGFEVTDAIAAHAEGKVSKLTKYFDAIQQITVTLSKAPSGVDFSAEVTVDVERHDDFIAHATGADLYLTIDAASQKASRQLTDYKERLKTHH